MPDHARVAHETGIQNALKRGWSVLSGGGSSLDAVEAAITVMEEDDTFDAGRGSFLTRDGRVQLDALLMSGHDLKAGGVACVERLRNPIQAARLVLDKSPHIYFVGEGAESFAAEHGLPLIQNQELVLLREQERLADFQKAERAGLPDLTFAGPTRLAPEKGTNDAGATTTQSAGAGLEQEPALDQALEAAQLEAEVTHGLATALPLEDPTLHSHDTVGAVALDSYGNLAAGTSTGGTLSKAPGRVGDSSLIGCGCYADNTSAAVSLTGWGEPIMKLVLGKWATDRVADGTGVQETADAAIRYLFDRLGGHGGIILLGPDGQIGVAHNTPRMAWGVANAGGYRFGTSYGT